jgi:hypothetical protein
MRWGADGLKGTPWGVTYRKERHANGPFFTETPILFEVRIAKHKDAGVVCCPIHSTGFTSAERHGVRRFTFFAAT